MNEKDLRRYKTKLLEIRDRSRAEINRMIEVVVTDAEAPGEHDRKVSESVEKEIVLEHTEETIRKAVLDALHRIDEGNYGQCQGCGKVIPKARLDAIPYASFCVACERKVER